MTLENCPDPIMQHVLFCILVWCTALLHILLYDLEKVIKKRKQIIHEPECNLFLYYKHNSITLIKCNLSVMANITTCQLFLLLVHKNFYSKKYILYCSLMLLTRCNQMFHSFSECCSCKGIEDEIYRWR